MNKKTKIITIIGIITIFLTIGISYAIYVASVSQSGEGTILSKCIGITKTSEENNINLQNAMPMLDDEGLELTPYRITVTNTCDVSTNFIITVDLLNIEGKTSSDYIPSSVVKVNVNGTTSLIGEGEEYTRIDNSYESRIIYYGIFAANETKEFNIRMWLDERATVEEAGNKYLNTKISVYSGQVPKQKGGEYVLAAWKENDISITETPLENAAFKSTAACASIPQTAIRSATTSSRSLTITYQGYYITYGTGYTISQTGTYTLTGVTTELYSTAYSKLANKYIVSTSPTSSSSGHTYTNVGNIYQVATSPYDENASVTMTYYTFTLPECTEILGVYLAPDDYGTSYYVRGSADYNFVKFGKDASGNDYWWRIIRINGDGSIRMIYQGISASGSTPALTGTSTQINSSTYRFNSSYDNNMYVGYMYTSGQRQGLGTSSNAKTELESWYKTNFEDNSTNATARSYIADRIFCGDRTSSASSSTAWTTPFTSTGGTGSTVTYYGAYLRLRTAKTPTLICPEDPDKYTTVSSDHGNKSLTYPIGLITADEVAMAGGIYGTGNTGYYLYTGQYYWTMSPYYFNGGTAREWYVDSSGYLHSDRVVSSSGLRAVINLSPESPISGAGTTTTPFQIATN